MRDLPASTASREIVGKFTVIIPTRNRPAFLAEAVASVLMQKHSAFELLIVNDGDAEIQNFSDTRVRVLNNSGRGAVPARNLGLAEASGDFIAFLDDDDFWIDELHLARANAALGDLAEFYFADGSMLFPDGSKRLFSRQADKSSLMVDNTILISTVCYRRDLHKMLGMFDEALPYYWDWDWYLRVANTDYRISRSNHVAAAIRVHPHNMSGDENRGARQANLDLLVAKHGMGKIILKNHLDFVR